MATKDDQQAIRNEIEDTRDNVAATVDELTERVEAVARLAVKPLVAAGILMVATIGVAFAVRKWRG